MSNGKILRRRDGAHGARHHPRRGKPAIPDFVAVVPPLCSCFRPQVLVACLCCGGMGWECPQERVPAGYVCVPTKPADTFADLLAPDDATPPAAAAAGQPATPAASHATA